MVQLEVKEGNIQIPEGLEVDGIEYNQGEGGASVASVTLFFREASEVKCFKERSDINWTGVHNED